MNHEEDKDFFKNDDSHRLIINDDDSEEEKEPLLETLVLKKGLSGYTVEKSRKIKKQKEQPLDQEKFIILPSVKTKPLTQKELSSVYTKYVEQSPFFAPLKNIILPQQSEATTSSNSRDICDKKVKIEIADQDPLIDSTSFSNTEAEKNLEYILPDEENIPSIQQLEFLEDENLKFQDDLEDTKQNYQLDSECMDKSLGGCSFVIKDCFLGEKNRNLSELDGFELKNSKLAENCMEAQFEEPILERLFSQVSDVSQSSTITANAESDELEFSDTGEENTRSPKKQTLPNEKLNIEEDEFIPVISKSDSDVYIIGSS